MFGDKKPAASGNAVIDQRAAAGPDNDVINAGISSGLEEYNLSDDFNNATGTHQGPPITPALDSNPGNLLQTRQGRLLQLRAMNPFVPILMAPQSAMARVLVNANTPLDIPIPSGAKMMQLKTGAANQAAYYSLMGNAAVPAADILDGTASVPFVNDEPLFFCEELQSVSVVSPVANCVVVASFWFQQ